MKTADITDIQVCRAFAVAEGSTRFADEILQEMVGAPHKVCVRAMERASKRGLVDSGVSLRGGWLTDAGRALVLPRHLSRWHSGSGRHHRSPMHAARGHHSRAQGRTTFHSATASEILCAGRRKRRSLVERKGLNQQTTNRLRIGSNAVRKQ